MSALSTPISQIRNGNLDSNNMNQQQMPPQIPQQMPIYNPNPPTQQPDMMPQQDMTQTQNNLVDELLTELEAQPEYQQDMNIAQTQYAMDQVNVPQSLNERVKQQLQPETTQSVSVNDNSSIVNNETQNMDSAYMFNNVNLINNKGDWIDNLLNELKPVIVVFILFLILSLHQVNRIIFSFVPKLLLENGQLSLYAILLKSLIAAIIYYGLMKLI